MPLEENDGRFAKYLDQYLAHLDGQAVAPALRDLSTEDQAELAALFRIIDANWAADLDLPPIDQDPVAQALGLVPAPASDSVAVAGSRIRERRQTLGLNRSAFAAALSRAGWTPSLQELTLLERADAEVLPRSQASALANALSTAIEDLAPAAGDPLAEFIAWIHSAEFDQIVARWATEAGRDPQAIAVEARSKMLAPARRSAGGGGRTEWLQTLQAILEAMI